MTDKEGLVLTPEELQDITGKYYQECNESEPPVPVLAIEIAGRVRDAQLAKVLSKLDSPEVKDKKQRHNWHWNKPSIGQRQCSKCGKISTIRSHSTLGGCKP